ncbi:hypothetical protein V2G26_012180 [Clonostachys chloroleuca]
MADRFDSSGRHSLDRDQVSPMNSFDNSDRQFRAPENDTFLHKHPHENVSEEFHQPAEKPRPAAANKGIFAIWWPEFVACFLVVGSFCALIGTVYPFQGQPLPRWPYGLSINTLISIYVIIFDMALMLIISSALGQLKFLWFQKARQLSDLQAFDEGAKGPWGAIVFLWVLRGRHIAASIGALVIIMAMFVAPFSQQLVRYYSCSEIDTSSTAQISRTNLVSSTGGIHTGAMMSNMDLPAQAAMYVGMFNEKRAQVAPTCSTGNCTFDDDYASAGYCRQCTDFTSQVETRKIDNTTKAQNISVPGWEVESNGYQYGFVIGPSNSTERPTLGGGVRIIFGTGNDTTRKEAADKCEGGVQASNWTCLGYGAAECVLTPCVRRYHGTVDKGEFKEDILSSTTEFGYKQDGGIRFSTIDMKCANSAEKDYLRSQNYVFDDSTEWLPYNLSLGIFSSQYNDTLSKNVRDECIYQGDRTDSNTLNSYFLNFFVGYIMDGFQGAGEGTSTAGKALFNMGETNFSFIDDKFDSVATSLTVYARNRRANNQVADYSNFSLPLDGQVMKMNSCVDVRWRWMALQAAVLALAAGFFASTLWMVGRTGDERIRNDFKTSVIPLLFLFHGMEGEVQKPSAPTVNSVEDIRQRAQHMRVALVKDENGWGFKEESS